MKKVIFKIIRFTGLPFIVREVFQKNKVSILLFHDISKEIAEQTLSCLSKRYNIIHLNDFIEAAEQGDKTKLPHKALILTFDDAHIRNYEILPVLKKYNISVTIFLCSSIINTNRHFWFKFQNQLYTTDDMKRMSNKKKLEILSEIGFDQEKEFEYPQALQKSHIEEMKGIVNMQSHTMFHPCLPRCGNAEAYAEISKSKELLEKTYNLVINAISYPNGDYSEREIRYVREAGYKCGITVDFGYNTIASDLFKLKRFSVNDTADLNELIVKASGVWAFFKTRNGRKQKFGFTTMVEE